MKDNLMRQVSNLIMKDADFRQISEQKDVYCPFAALGAARMEIRHSNFLANLINPNENHGFGDLLLKGFLEALLGQTDATELLLDLHLTDLSDAVVLREWKDVDLLVRLPRSSKKQDLIFAIEIKIEANESQGQLKKYEEAVTEAWPQARTLFFFLTPDHAEASRETWVDVPFSEVLNEFERSLALGEGQSDARRLAELYIQMMRRNYVADEKMNDLAAQIWGRHRAALEFLIEHQPNAASELLVAVKTSNYLEIITQKLEELRFDLTFEVEQESSRFLRLSVKEWDAAKGMKTSSAEGRLLILEVEFHNGGVHARWVVGRGPQEYRMAFVSALDPNRRRAVTKDWTRISNEALFFKAEMKKAIEDGLSERNTAKVISGLADYASRTAAKFDVLLRKANLF